MNAAAAQRPLRARVKAAASRWCSYQTPACRVLTWEHFTASYEACTSYEAYRRVMLGACTQCACYQHTAHSLLDPTTLLAAALTPPSPSPQTLSLSGLTVCARFRGCHSWWVAQPAACVRSQSLVLWCQRQDCRPPQGMGLHAAFAGTMAHSNWGTLAECVTLLERTVTPIVRVRCTPSTPPPWQVPYAMSKGAELALTRSLSSSLISKGGWETSRLSMLTAADGPSPRTSLLALTCPRQMLYGTSLKL